MNNTRLSRPLIIIPFILVAGTFIVGTLRSFTPAFALANATPTFTLIATPTITLVLTKASTLPAEPANGTLSPTPTATGTAEAESEQVFTPTPAPLPEFITDMTGIITLAVLMVVVILVGVAWGGRLPHKKKTPKK